MSKKKVVSIKDKKRKKSVKSKHDRKPLKELAIGFFSPTTKKLLLGSPSVLVQVIIKTMR